MSSHLLKPKSAGKKVVEYVWYADDSVKVYDLSGSTTLANKRTSYTVQYSADQSLFVGPDNKVYNSNEISGNDISGSLYKFKFFVADNTGILPMNFRNVSNSGQHYFDISTANIVDLAFTDRDGKPYYSSYNSNYKIKANGDISLNFTTGPYFNSNTTDLSVNFLLVNDAARPNVNVNYMRLDLSSFDLSDNHVNPTTLDCSLAIVTNLPLIQNSVANTTVNDVSSNIIFKLYRMGIDSITNVTKYSNLTSVPSGIDLSVNCISSSAYLTIEPNNTQILAKRFNYPQPNQDVGSLLPETFPIGKAGRSNVRIPYVIPGGLTGFWSFKVTLHDTGSYGGDFTASQTFDFTLNPSLNEPVVSLKTGSSNTLAQGESASSFLHFNPIDYTIDICNNNNIMYYKLRMLPANNSAFDISLSDLSKNFTLTDSSTNVLSTYLYNANDVSLNILYRSDISTNNPVNASRIVMLASDLSFNNTANKWVKNSDTDLSNTVVLTFRGDASDNLLPDRSFNIYADWLSNNSTDAKPQTVKVGTFNAITKYSTNVTITDNKDGTFSLTSSDFNNFDISTCYKVKIFTSATLKTPATSGTHVSWTGIRNSNISQITSSNENNFYVQMDSNFSATFTAPKVLGNNKYYMVAYIAPGPSSSEHKYTVSNVAQLTSNVSVGLTITAEPASLTLSNLSTVINIDPSLEVDTTISDLSGYIVQDQNIFQDLSFNIGFPNWWQDINGLNVTVSVVDTSNVVKLFDVSGAFTKSRGTPSNSVTFTDMRDLSNNIFVDLSYNKFSDDIIFGLNITVSDANNTVYKNATRQLLLYYRGQKLGVTNTGGVRTSLIVYNDTKYIFENVPDKTLMTLGTRDTYGVFSSLIGSAANSYCLNLARTEFVGEDKHTFDISGFDISYNNSTATFVNTSDAPIAYISYNNWGGSGFSTRVATSSVTTTQLITTTFARSAFSWVDIKKFIGCIDIYFKTKNSTGNLSVNVNTLRLVVIPRPSLQLTIGSTPNVLVNTSAPIQTYIQNIQQNKAGANLELGSWNPTDISGGSYLITKIRTILKVSSGSLSLVTLAGAPDVVNAGLFTLPSNIGDIAYGSTVNTPSASRVNPVVVFKGRPTAGLVSSNLQIQYTSYGNKPITDRKALSVAVYSSDSVYSNSEFTNNLSANTQFNFAGMPFIQYITLDNSNNTIALDTDSRTKNAAFVVVENKSINNGSVTATSLTGLGASGNALSLGTSETAVFQHNATNTWLGLYKKA